MHLQKIARAVSARARRDEGGDFARWHSDGLVAGIAFRERLLLRHAFADVAHHFPLVFHANDQVNTIESGNLLWFQLRIASHHHHKGSRMFTREAVDGLSALMVGHVGDRAGVDDTYIGMLPLFSGTHALSGQSVAQGRRFGKIEFTS